MKHEAQALPDCVHVWRISPFSLQEHMLYMSGTEEAGRSGFSLPSNHRDGQRLNLTGVTDTS